MIEAYCWPQSVVPGESVELFCSTSSAQFSIEIVRQGRKDETVYSATGLAGAEHATPADAASHGCRWPASTAIEVGDDWTSGMYLVRLKGDGGESTEAFFVVRATRAAPSAHRMLLVLSTSTWAAYNDWGGANYYLGGHISSLQRPLPKGFLTRPEPRRLRMAKVAEIPMEEVQSLVERGYSLWIPSAGWAGWEHLFVQWAEREGIGFDYAISTDLETVPDLLDPYDVYLSVGHDEYWSAGMRDAVENFVDGGGRAAFFSGNTAFWQIRYEDDFRRQVAYKMDIEADPVWGTDEQHTLSTMWSDPAVGRPENHMTGVTYTRGGYAHVAEAPQGTGGYTVWRPEHWAFAGLDMRSGDVLGSEDAIIVGYECDGCELAMKDGRPVATGADGTPESFEVLATAPAHLWTTEERPTIMPLSGIGELNWIAQRLGGADTAEMRERFAYGRAVMGSFARGQGEVFTTGCTDWAFGLEDENVSQVTKNVLNHFLAGKDGD